MEFFGLLPGGYVDVTPICARCGAQQQWCECEACDTCGAIFGPDCLIRVTGNYRLPRYRCRACAGLPTPVVVWDESDEAEEVPF